MALSRRNIPYRLGVAIISFAFGISVFLLGSVSNSALAQELIPEDTAAACAAAGGTCPPDSFNKGIDANCNRVATTPISYDIIGFCDGAAQKKSCCKLKAAAASKTTPLAGTAGTPPAGTTGASSGGSCSGGVCSGGACPTAYPNASGACSSADGGGTCCKANAGSSTASPPIEFKNPLAFNTVEDMLASILITLRGIIVILALVFIVIGAVLYITSAGNEGQMTLAKGAITAAMIGLALGIAAPSFLKEIGTVLNWQGISDNAAVSGALTLSQIARNVLNFLLSIVGILGIIMLVIGGIMYLTAAGDEERVETGKKIVTYSIIGIVVALAALVIVSQIAAFFG